MSTPRRISRRNLLTATVVGVSGAIAGTVLPGRQRDTEASANPSPADPKIRGPFLILSTPFTASGEVDFDTLANEARFLDWTGCPGMIWPQSGDSVDLLTTEEKLHGMEVLAKTARGLRSALCLGVQGKDTDEMLMYAKYVEKLAPAAIISRPPDSGKTEDDMRQYWRALGAVATRPVIIQTTGGTTYKGPDPSPKLMIDLAKEFPHFGYIKEESGNVMARMRALVAAKPTIRCVFGAHGGFKWLHQLRIGAEGLITERVAYADVLTRVWELQQSGENPEAQRDAYSKFLLMLNLKDTISGGDLRGPHLYVLKKRGVFKTTVSRHYGPRGVIPAKPIFSALKLTPEEIAEIDFRFEALKPYLKQGSPVLT